MGRQYVHGKVAETLSAALAARWKLEEGRIVVIGETGFRNGGPFPPHKSHENGLSVDIMMPVRKSGKISIMPTHPWQKFGYSNEFDDNGRMGEYSIDFESLASLIVEIDKQAAERLIRIDRIIVAPEYVSKLLSTKAGKNFGRLEKAIMRKPAWIRHDEHVHLDFALTR
jgi:penicillin-insensitive murein endopeptidase